MPRPRVPARPGAAFRILPPSALAPIGRTPGPISLGGDPQARERLAPGAAGEEPSPDERIDAEKALRSRRRPRLVPSTRQLVRRDRNGDGNVWGLATAVASDDIGGDGSIICSNGRSVFVLHVDGRVDPALSAPLAGEVIALRS